MNLKTESFVCIDCESTGLDPKTDRMIEIAVAVFSFDAISLQYETLINPGQPIPEESIKIHHITDEMVMGKPSIQEVLPYCLELIDRHTIIGHGIKFDIDLILNEAQRHNIPCTIHQNTFIDTLRLARLYGESPVNSLEYLRGHFNIEKEGAHRAMSDVIVNIQVFKKLTKQFSSTKKILERLKHPILLKNMPLGKHKGRAFREIPIEYLRWAARQDFDLDLMHSIHTELSRRKKGSSFQISSNPFNSLS